MTNWRVPSGGVRVATFGGDTADTTAIQVDGHATLTHTEGAWVELISSTAFDTDYLYLTIRSLIGTAGATGLVDIAIGAASSEVVIVSDLFVSLDALTNVTTVTLPIRIPAGTRVAARLQGSVAASIVDIAGALVSGGFGTPAPFSKIISLGVDSANTRGTNLGDGANWTAHTKKAYVEITSSLPENIEALAFALHSVGASSTSMLLDIAIGAAASEVAILSDLYAVGSGTDRDMHPPISWQFAFAAEKGSRIAARCQGNNSAVPANADKTLILYGFVR